MHNKMITVRKLFSKKIPTLQTPHIVFSTKKDYNTLAMQVFIGEHHHNSNSKRLLLEPNLANRTRWFKHFPGPAIIVIFNLETICGLTKPWAKIMWKTTMPRITHLSFVTLRIALVIEHGENFRGKKWLLCQRTWRRDQR